MSFTRVIYSLIMDRPALYRQLSKLYRTPAFPGAYKGLTTFHKYAKNHPTIRAAAHRLSLQEVKDWSQTDQLVNKNRPVRRKFMRRPYNILNPNAIWEGDLLDMSSYATQNRGVKFIVMLVDQFTKKLYTEPIKSKSAMDVNVAFHFIFEFQTMARPNILYTDNGKEFTNSLLQNYLTNTLHIKHVTTKNDDIKCAIVERTNRSFKSVLVKHLKANNGKYINDLSVLTDAYNNTAPSTTQIAPNAVDPTNLMTVQQNMTLSHAQRNHKLASASWDKDTLHPKLNVGQWVRILAKKQTFQRGYHQPFTDQIFQITDVGTSGQPVTYKLADLNKDPISGTFYYNELSPIQFPKEFRLNETFRPLQLTSPHDNQRYKKILIREYYQPIWVPESVLTRRSNLEKQNRTIKSSIIMHWLLGDTTDNKTKNVV